MMKFPFIPLRTLALVSLGCLFVFLTSCGSGGGPNCPRTLQSSDLTSKSITLSWQHECQVCTEWEVKFYTPGGLFGWFGTTARTTVTSTSSLGSTSFASSFSLASSTRYKISVYQEGSCWRKKVGGTLDVTTP